MSWTGDTEERFVKLTSTRIHLSGEPMCFCASTNHLSHIELCHYTGCVLLFCYTDSKCNMRYNERKSVKLWFYNYLPPIFKTRQCFKIVGNIFIHQLIYQLAWPKHDSRGTLRFCLFKHPGINPDDDAVSSVIWSIQKSKRGPKCSSEPLNHPRDIRIFHFHPCFPTNWQLWIRNCTYLVLMYTCIFKVWKCFLVVFVILSFTCSKRAFEKCKLFICFVLKCYLASFCCQMSP